MGRYLLTGVAGLIASRVAELPLTGGHTVVGVDNLNDASASGLHPGTGVAECDAAKTTRATRKMEESARIRCSHGVWRSYQSVVG